MLLDPFSSLSIKTVTDGYTDIVIKNIKKRLKPYCHIFLKIWKCET
jgi:hypothetical protein